MTITVDVEISKRLYILFGIQHFRCILKQYTYLQDVIIRELTLLQIFMIEMIFEE